MSHYKASVFNKYTTNKNAFKMLKSTLNQWGGTDMQKVQENGHCFCILVAIQFCFMYDSD